LLKSGDALTASIPNEVLLAYLFGVARKQAAEWRRKQKPLDELDFDLSGHGGTELASMIVEGLTHLTFEQRTLLWLREVEGQSYDELAMILDVPVGTVRSRLFSAREAFRAVWGIAHQHSGGRHDL
jgi:RNA polymerase sigma-70 factor, ECF subfamily